MKLGIVYDKRKLTKIFIKEAKKYFEDVKQIQIAEIKFKVKERNEIFVNRSSLFSLDYLFALPSIKNKEIFYTILRMISGVVKTNINPSSYLMFLNKGELYKMLKKKGIKVRKRILVNPRINLEKIKKRIKFPITLIGGGRIVKVNTFSVLKGVVSSFTSMESIELCFPIKRRKGYWVFSIGKKIFSYETKRKKVVFIKEIEKLVEKIKEVFNPDFFGVKLLETENGFVVDRIILNPDLVSLEKVFGRKIFKDLFSYIKSKAEKPSAMDILFKILGRFRV